MLIPVPFATTNDLVARWRTLTPTETTLAETLLDDASNQVVSECASANFVEDTDTAGQALRVAMLKRIVCAMVKRAMISVSGDDAPPISEMQQSAGPFGYREKYANPTGDLYLTKAERRQLPCGKQSAFTISMLPDDADLS